VSDRLKVVFLGSGPIASPVLEALANSAEIDLLAVITQPDRPAGRKRIPTPTPLGAKAAELGLDAQKVTDVNSESFLESLRLLSPDMLCVVSFGQILKAPLLELPRLGCVNVHASILPAYRGASPIVRAILNGDVETGVAFMQMERGLDSGPVYKTLYRKLDGTEYADELEMDLGRLAASEAPEILKQIAGGVLLPVAQDPEKVSICRKISKRDGVINWERQSAAEVAAMVRAYYPWPGALCEVCAAGSRCTALNICSARVISGFEGLKPGECADLPKRIVVGCADNSALEIMELIPTGAKKMDAASFRNGLRGALPEFLTEEPI